MATPVQSQSKTLLGGKCTHCEKYGYPYRRWCSVCGNEAEEVELSGAATLHAWTVIRIAPRNFAAPYVIGYARLREGPRVLVKVDAEPDQLYPDIGLALSRSTLPSGGGRQSVGLEARPTGARDA